MAAILVVLTHAAYTTGKYGQGYLGLVYSRAEIGVPIFFVLSGFLLFRPWVKAAATGGEPPSVRRYGWHRVRRIMPAYVVTVLIAYLLYHFRTAGPNPGHTWMGLFRNLTLSQIYTDNYLFAYLHQGLTQMWSLAVEVSFYLVLPLLALLARRLPVDWRVPAIAALAVASFAWPALPWHLPFGVNQMNWLPALFSWFAAGMLLAELTVMPVGRMHQLARRRWVMAAIAGVAFVIAATPLAGNIGLAPGTVGQVVVKTAMGAVVAGALLAPLVLDAPGTPHRILGSTTMVTLGRWSYGLFIWHLAALAMVFPVIGEFPFNGHMPIVLILTWVFGFAIAAVSYGLIESPCRELLRRWESRHAPSPRDSSITDVPEPAAVG